MSKWHQFNLACCTVLPNHRPVVILVSFKHLLPSSSGEGGWQLMGKSWWCSKMTKSCKWRSGSSYNSCWRIQGISPKKVPLFTPPTVPVPFQFVNTIHSRKFIHKFLHWNDQPIEKPLIIPVWLKGCSSMNSHVWNHQCILRVALISELQIQGTVSVLY